MIIGQPELLQADGQAIYQVKVGRSGASDILWYSVDEEFSDLMSDTADAALVALLIPAMTTGQDIEVSGRISARLLYNASRPYQTILQHVIPSLRRVRIHAEKVYHAGERAPGVATGFSGGIDSFCAIADHHKSDVPPGFRLTHFLYNNVGSHGKGGETLFMKRYNRLRSTADRIGLPLVRVNSNLGEFYREYSFEQTHTPRNLSVALVLGKGIGRFMYASAYQYADVFVGASDSMAYTDTLTLPLLSTELVDAASVGSEYSRVEKTLRASTVPESYDALDVCVTASHAGPGMNCSRCWKCLRTMLTLDIAGKLDFYSSCFDLDVYEKHKANFMAETLISQKPLAREIVEFAKARGYSFPADVRLYASMDRYHLLGVFKGMQRLGKSIRGGR
jgi:hypothetical protein